MLTRCTLLTLAALPLFCVGAAAKHPCDEHPKPMVVDELIARKIVLRSPGSKYSIILDVDGDSARISVLGTYGRQADMFIDGNNLSILTKREGRPMTVMGIHEAGVPVLVVYDRNGIFERYTLSGR